MSATHASDPGFGDRPNRPIIEPLSVAQLLQNPDHAVGIERNRRKSQLHDRDPLRCPERPGETPIQNPETAVLSQEQVAGMRIAVKNGLIRLGKNRFRDQRLGNQPGQATLARAVSRA